MLNELERVWNEVVISISQASTEKEISEIRVKALGKKGGLTQLLKRLGTLPEADRREIGKRANQVKEDLERKIEGALFQIQEREGREVLEREKIDVTLPGRRIPIGKRHPLTQILDEIIDIFSRLGFEVVEGPEVELDYYNFEALNIPKGHPAREMQATFFISEDVVLRTSYLPHASAGDGEEAAAGPHDLSRGGLPLRFRSNPFSGLQLGAQEKAVILLFLDGKVLDDFRKSDGWEVGVDGSVAVVEWGTGGSIDTSNIKDPIIGFVFVNKGLIFNLTLEGSKMSKIKR